MTKKEVDSRNATFMVSAISTLATKNAQFAVAIGVSEQNELMIMSTQLLTDKEVYQILQEASRAIQNKMGGIILLN